MRVIVFGINSLRGFDNELGLNGRKPPIKHCHSKVVTVMGLLDLALEYGACQSFSSKLLAKGRDNATYFPPTDLIRPIDDGIRLNSIRSLTVSG